MSVMTSQITSLTIVYSSVYSDADQRKHQSSASLAFVRGIHRWPLNSPHKGPATRKNSPFDDVIMVNSAWGNLATTGTIWVARLLLPSPSPISLHQIMLKACVYIHWHWIFMLCTKPVFYSSCGCHMKPWPAGQLAISNRYADYHIEAETKWTPFCRRHFQGHFLEWKCLNSD